MSLNDPIYDLVVLRYGELFLKGANRSRFEAVLEQNVRNALSALPSPILERAQGRLFVVCPAEEIRRATAILGRVFGFSSLSPAIQVSPEMEEIGQAALRLAQHAVALDQPRSFRIKARRSDKRFPLPSPEIGRQIGSTVFESTGLKVDLTAPDLTLGVEVGAVRSFVYYERQPGAGGLPVGVSGRVALLLSGGIDSPVAGHLMQKRGCVLHGIYFHSPPYTGPRTKDKVCELARKLAPAQGGLDLEVVNFTKIQEAIRKNAPAEMAVVLYRRMMMRIASVLARRSACLAIATGDSLGQVASQTLENMSCVQESADLPVLRPLLTYDKAETIALAQRIGTYERSIEPYEDCCSLFVPKHPLIRARTRTVQRFEHKLDLQELLDEATANSERIPLT